MAASAGHVLERDATFDISFHVLHEAGRHVTSPPDTWLLFSLSIGLFFSH